MWQNSQVQLARQLYRTDTGCKVVADVINDNDESARGFCVGGEREQTAQQQAGKE
jgi:hypothetical protein